MKKWYVPLAACALFAFVADTSRDSFQRLKQLAGGTWVQKGNTRQVCERWMVKDDHTLTGRGFYVRGTDTSWQEQVQLALAGDSLTYTSVVANQNDGTAVVFRLIPSESNVFTFTNPQHDFPQHISYQFIGKDSLHAWISGQAGGRERRVDFYYARK